MVSGESPGAELELWLSLATGNGSLANDVVQSSIAVFNSSRGVESA